MVRVRDGGGGGGGCGGGEGGVRVDWVGNWIHTGGNERCACGIKGRGGGGGGIGELPLCGRVHEFAHACLGMQLHACLGMQLHACLGMQLRACLGMQLCVSVRARMLA